MRKDNPIIQGAFKGTHKFCQQCLKDCKQFENVKIVNCPNFSSKQSKELQTSK